MGYSPRKLFEIQILFRFNRTSDNCSPIPAVRKYGPKNPLPPPLPPPLLDSDQKHLFAAGMSVMIIILLLGIVCVIVRKYYWGRNDYRSRRNSPTFLNTRVNFGDVDQGPGLDHHPMWHINTVGFPQAMIDKITIVKFKKGEGLIEGTECSVCLSEFEEDESLRLLPKCNHAFHVPCIDTWLLSDKNCPLCRVPAISDDMFRSNFDLNSYIELRIENTMENFESDRQERNNSNAEERGSEIGRVTNVHGDNGNDNRDQPMNEDDEQPMRRSISFDSLSASMIDNDGKIQEGNLELNNVGSPSTNKLKRSSSMEHKGTITAMRRSFSSFRQNRRR